MDAQTFVSSISGQSNNNNNNDNINSNSNNNNNNHVPRDNRNNSNLANVPINCERATGRRPSNEIIKRELTSPIYIHPCNDYQLHTDVGLGGEGGGGGRRKGRGGGGGRVERSAIVQDILFSTFGSSKSQVRK